MRSTTEAPATTPLGFPYPDLDAAPREVREKFESLPAKINLFRMLAHIAGLYVPLMDFTQAVFKRLELSKHHYELVVLFTGRRTGAGYEWRQHLNTAPKAGVKEDQIRAIEAGRIDDVAFDGDERLVLRMADELLRDVEVSRETLAEAAGRLSSVQILEVMLVVGFYRRWPASSAR